eukprot:TRINITY_DN7167_c0_g3_i1.p1 TRINITY_DN7167_c0_g3~~TRINITY_DN7167_c0_g3_i1.p1  ORF type:complete len:236 (+),score=20.82 TRINITY_DN7167_c0_g3_i1:67-708(+)
MSPLTVPKKATSNKNMPMPAAATGSGAFGSDDSLGKCQPYIHAKVPGSGSSKQGESHGNCHSVILATAPSSCAPDQGNAHCGRPGASATKKHTSWLAQQPYASVNCTVRMRISCGVGRAVVTSPSNSVSELGLMMLRQGSRSSLTIAGIDISVEMNMKFPGWFLRWDVPSGRSAALSEERIASKFDTFIEQLVAIERSECAPTDEMVPTCNLD